MQCVSINGIHAEHLSVMDRGLQYGDGLFETIACVDGELQFWEQHIQRMRAGAAILKIDFPDAEYFLQDIRNLCSITSENNFVVKIILTRGQGSRGYLSTDTPRTTRIVIRSDWPDYSPDLINTGISACLCKHPVSINPALAGIKHLNRLDNVIARNEWHNEYHEGLMLDTDGYVIEGTMSNVFAVRSNILYTPMLDRSGVDGVIRNQVINIARDEKIKIETARLTMNDLYLMDEIFVSNSIIGIWPVRMIEQQAYLVGEMSKKMHNQLQQRMSEHAKKLA